MAGLDRQKVREAVCSAIAISLRRSGRGVPEFKDSDKPVSEYEGFDSQLGVEVTLELEEILKLADLGTNIFVKDSGKAARARSIREIVDYIATILARGGVN